MTEIFYIEDDSSIAKQVQQYFLRKEWDVKCFSTLQKAKTELQIHEPSLLLLDWNMPDGKGTDFCRWVREYWKEIPIIFITVKNDTADIVSGFDYGADDYVTKPFDLEVLYSRIQAVLRRAGRKENTLLSCSSLVLDITKKAVFSQEEEIPLSRQEYQILKILMENQGRTITRQYLLESIWDSKGQYVNDNTLTVTMKRLRQKLHHPSCIKTIRSFGYRIEETQ